VIVLQPPQDHIRCPDVCHDPWTWDGLTSLTNFCLGPAGEKNYQRILRNTLILEYKLTTYMCVSCFLLLIIHSRSEAKSPRASSKPLGLHICVFCRKAGPRPRKTVSDEWRTTSKTKQQNRYELCHFSAIHVWGDDFPR